MSSNPNPIKSFSQALPVLEAAGYEVRDVKKDFWQLYKDGQPVEEPWPKGAFIIKAREIAAGVPQKHALAPAPAAPLVTFYNALDVETRIVVQQKASEIRDRWEAIKTNRREIGERLLEVKERLGHGNFGAWIQAEFGMSQDTAENFMRYARAIGQIPNGSEFEDQIAPAAFYALGGPSTPQEAIEAIAQRAQEGEYTTGEQAREIIKAHQQQGASTTLEIPMLRPGTVDVTRIIRTGNPRAGAAPTERAPWLAPVVDPDLYRKAREKHNGSRLNEPNNIIYAPLRHDDKLWCPIGEVSGWHHAPAGDGGLLCYLLTPLAEYLGDLPFRHGPTPEAGYLGVVAQYAGIAYILTGPRLQILEAAPTAAAAPQSNPDHTPMPPDLFSAGWRLAKLDSGRWQLRKPDDVANPSLDDDHLPSLIEAGRRAQQILVTLRSGGWMVEEASSECYVAIHDTYGETDDHVDLDTLYDQAMELEAEHQGEKKEASPSKVPDELAAAGWSLHHRDTNSGHTDFWCKHEATGWATTETRYPEQAFQHARGYQARIDDMKLHGWAVGRGRDQYDLVATHPRFGQVGPCRLLAQLHTATQEAEREALPTAPYDLEKAGWRLVGSQGDGYMFTHAAKRYRTAEHATHEQAVADARAFQQRLANLKDRGWFVSQYDEDEGMFAAHGSHSQVGPYHRIDELHSAVLAVMEGPAEADAQTATAIMGLRCACGIASRIRIDNRDLCDLHGAQAIPMAKRNFREHMVVEINDLLSFTPVGLFVPLALLLVRFDPEAFGLEHKLPDDCVRILGRVDDEVLSQGIARALTTLLHDPGSELELQLIRKALEVEPDED